MGCAQCSANKKASPVAAPTPPAPTTAAPPPQFQTQGHDAEARSSDAIPESSEVPSERQPIDGEVPRENLALEVSATTGAVSATSGASSAPSAEPDPEDAERQLTQADALIAEASAEALRLIKIGDAFAAERLVFEAIDKLEAYSSAIRFEAIQRLRSSEGYVATVDLIDVYEQGVKDCVGSADEGGSQWNVAGECQVDFKDLGLTVDAETAAMLKPEYRVIKILYRRMPGRVEMRVKAMLPTQATNAKSPSLTGWVSMYREIGHYDTWNPVIVGKGPAAMQPREKYVNLYQSQSKIMWSKSSQLSEENMFFNHDAGTFLLRVNDVPSGDGRWQLYPEPKGYAEDTTKITFTGLGMVQKHTTLLSMSIIANIPKPPPEMVLKFAITWLMPNLARRMLKAAARALGADGPHYPLIEADADGLYKESRELVGRGLALDEQRDGRLYSPDLPPEYELVSSRPRRLTKYEATHDPHRASKAARRA